jgi:hypothetical protein
MGAVVSSPVHCLLLSIICRIRPYAYPLLYYDIPRRCALTQYQRACAPHRGVGACEGVHSTYTLWLATETIKTFQN